MSPTDEILLQHYSYVSCNWFHYFSRKLFLFEWGGGGLWNQILLQEVCKGYPFLITTFQTFFILNIVDVVNMTLNDTVKLLDWNVPQLWQYEFAKQVLYLKSTPNEMQILLSYSAWLFKAFTTVFNCNSRSLMLQ